MHAVQYTRWFALAAAAALLLGVFLTMGYGIIGLVFLFIVGALIGGALMSYLD